MKEKLMKTGRIIILLLLSIFTFQSCDNTTEPLPVPAPDIDEVIGQMLMVGFRGFDIQQDNFIYRDLTQYKIGGVVLYDRDVTLGTSQRNIQSPEQLRNLVAQLNSISAGKLLIAIDQEGGRVNRLKTAYGFPPTVSAQYLGNLNNPDSTYGYTYNMAQTIAGVNINLNFAPVVDVNVNPNNPVIGGIERSFSADPNLVVSHAEKYMQAHRNSKVFTCLKHFPGHGSSQTDSHLGFTDVTNTWSNAELIPYRELLKKGIVEMIMTAHIFNANLDSTYPATLSKNIIDGMLRKDLGYDGVVITDDMQMKAITDHYGLEQAVERSLEAGVDIILFSNNSAYDPEIVPKVTGIIKNLIAQGKIEKARLYNSYNRIMNLKRK
ncbi:MAG TPA: glycoside hydrolase family 3 N-terminal domain-containing protein [Ignavibacteriaceae bacterium]|nr:glycoside hydrolase family 3 N-terminal domain-containing protein [Ignavibacteriaceae bacterium]